MSVKLYVIPVSHSAAAARMMLEYKGVPHQTVRLISGLHPPLLRLAGFPGGTVPALRFEGRRVQGSLKISRFLDEVSPQPPLFPGKPEARRAVEEAEAWGANVLQEVPRRLYRWALVRDPQLRHELALANRLPFPGLMSVLMQPLARLFARKSGGDDVNVRLHLAQLPEMLAHVDGLLGAGVIGASVPNAATFQIAPSLRFLMNFEQLAPLLGEGPAARFARELLPGYPGPVGRVFPQAWIGTKGEDPD
jgi:glutathione S-transferase